MQRAVALSLFAGIILARLPGLDDPLFGLHHYRMNETAAMARNFYESSMNILFPQIDWGGSGPGYIEEAFQLYSFLVAALYKLFGVSEVIGRGLSLVFYVVSAVLIHRLTVRVVSERAGLFALFFFGTAPLGLYYGRSFQPDSLILLCSVSSIYLFLIWTETNSRKALWGSALVLSAAVLMKPVNLYLGLPLLHLCHRRFSWAWLKQPELWLYAGLAIAPCVLWYAHAHSLWLRYGNTNGMWGQGFSMFGAQTLLLDPSFHKTMGQYLVYLITTVAGFPLFLMGLMLRQKSGIYVPHYWLAGFAVAVLITAGAQVGHEYYWMPMIAVASLLMGAGADYLWNMRLRETFFPETLPSKALVLSLCVIVALAAGRRMREYYTVPPNQMVEQAFAERLRELSDPGSLVVVGFPPRGELPAERQRHRDPDGMYTSLGPVELYQSHRKGWCLRFEDWSFEFMESLRRKGAQYFATWYVEGLEGNPQFSRDLGSNYKTLDRTPDWAIYHLTATGAVSK